ncbi:MAG TPA: T9SS type A sorting domain-containing protein [Bacteroidia bacterium]|nr:T9SS type A sorting domain-containing protein [Bacteroidia bacterium]
MKKLFALLIIMISSIEVFSQVPAIQWKRCLGGTLHDGAMSIQQTNDGGFIAAGYTYSNDGDVFGNHNTTGGGEDIWVVKLDDNGDVQWQKCLGSGNWDGASAIRQTVDGGYIVAGYATSNGGDVSGNHGDDCWIVKLDDSGTIQWQKCLGGTGVDYATSIQQTPDSGYIVLGTTSSNDGDVTGIHNPSCLYPDSWFVKLNSSGTVQWKRCLGGDFDDGSYSIIIVSDGYVFTASTLSNNGDVSGNHSAGYDIWVVKTNFLGVIQWQKCLGGIMNEFTGNIQQTGDGGYILTGASGSNDGDVSGNHGNDDFWVVKLDYNGTVQWQKCLGGTGYDKANSILQTLDGGYIVLGDSWSNDGDITGHHGITLNGDYWVVKLDEYGVMEWQKSLGGTENDYSHSILQTNDGGFLIAGETYSSDDDVVGSHGAFDVWIVKLAPEVGVEELDSFSSLNLFPNPATSEITVQSGKFKVERIEMYSVVGERIERLTPTLSKGEGVRVDVSALPSGIYFVTVTDDAGNRAVRKVVKM